MLILTREQVREVDQRAIAEYGMSGLVLMENAGRRVADLIYRLIIERSRTKGTKSPTDSVTVVCGKGNNGGDGFVIARHLDLHAFPSRCCCCAIQKSCGVMQQRILGLSRKRD